MPSLSDAENHPEFRQGTRTTLVSKADDALEAARQLPHGPARVEALKKAGLARSAADKLGLIFAAKGRPRK